MLACGKICFQIPAIRIGVPLERARWKFSMPWVFMRSTSGHRVRQSGSGRLGVSSLNSGRPQGRLFWFRQVSRQILSGGTGHPCCGAPWSGDSEHIAEGGDSLDMDRPSTGRGHVLLGSEGPTMRNRTVRNRIFSQISPPTCTRQWIGHQKLNSAAIMREIMAGMWDFPCFGPARAHLSRSKRAPIAGGHKRVFRTLQTSKTSGTATLRRS
jgi:hypothetical protein